MKAIVQHGYGSDEVLSFEDVDMPAVGDHDVLVRVRATSVNAADWFTTIGKPYLIRAISGLRSPRVPVAGKALAGEVVSIGGQVSGFAVGDEVWAEINGGAFAEYASVPAKRLARKPAGSDVRAGRGGPAGRDDGPAGAARRGPAPGRPVPARQRRVRRGRHVRGPDRQGVRGRGHRRVQHPQRRPRPRGRRRPRHRLHPRGADRPVRRHPRPRRQPLPVPPALRPDRARDRGPLGRRGQPRLRAARSDRPGGHPVAGHPPAAASAGGDVQRGGPRRPRPARRRRVDHPRDRPHLPAELRGDAVRHLGVEHARGKIVVLP